MKKLSGAMPVAVTILMVLALVLVVGFFWMVFGYYRQIKSGAAPAVPRLSLAGSLASFSATGSEPVGEIGDSDDPSIGPADAKLTIVEFVDYQCPFTAEVSGDVRRLVLKYGDSVRLIIRDFPLQELHSSAILTAEAAGCAEAQGKFWPMHDRIFAAKVDLSRAVLDGLALRSGLDAERFAACLDDHERMAEIKKDLRDGVAAGVRGTPTFFFNGEPVPGALPAEVFEQLINAFLRR